MPKNKLKINSKYLDKLGLDVSADELPTDACIKRVNFNSPLEIFSEVESKELLRSPLDHNPEIDVVQPHIMRNKDEFSVGIITTIDVDSDGDVVLPKGVDTSRYEKNPVVLFQHNLNMPIGYAEEIKISEEDITAKTRYGSTEEAKKVHQLLKDKVLRTHSIGFVTLESEVRGTKAFEVILNDLKSRFPNKFNEETSKRVDRFVTKSLLLEYSIVTIPSNQEAVINEIKSIKISKDEDVEVKSTDKIIACDKSQSQSEARVSSKARHSEEIEEVEVIEEPIVEEVVEAKEVIEELFEEEDEVEEEDELIEVKEIETTKGSSVSCAPCSLPTIKIFKRGSTIKKLSTQKERDQERLKKAFMSLWGV